MAAKHELRIGDVVLDIDEAEATLAAIRAGKVDAVMVKGRAGDEILTFRDPSHPYRLLVEAMAEGAALTTPDGVICYHNSWFGQVVGPTDAALTGRALGDLVTADQRPELERLLRRAGTSPPARGEIALLGRDGRGVRVQLAITPARLVDVPVYCVVMTDLSEHRRQEALYQRAREELEARDRLFSVAAHELRGPLTALELQTQLLLRALAQNDAARACERAAPMVRGIERQGRLLAELVGKLMDVGTIGSGRFHLSPEPMDLADAVRAVVERAAEPIARSGSTVTLELAPARGRWDRVRLEQVAGNLLSNALKYGLGKPIRISVGAAGGVARLLVEDQGSGIPPEARERIFRPYERIANTGSQPGFGLGLFITAEIVKAHGGTIRVEGAPGVGSRFLVELPLGAPT